MGKSKQPKAKLKRLLACVTDENLHPETSTGNAVGAEMLAGIERGMQEVKAGLGEDGDAVMARVFGNFRN